MKIQNSYQFNMKKNISIVLKPCSILENSSELLDFYIHNKNPSIEQISKFAKEKGLLPETVEKYIREKERLDQTEINIINMKYGFKYSRPAESLVRDYENSLDSTFNLGLDLNEELIPKKRKYKENINANGAWKDVNPKLISEIEEYISHDLKGIIEAKGMNCLISMMKKETKLENKNFLLTILNNTSYHPAIERFMQLQGTNLLSDWISEIKEKIEKKEKYEKSEKFTLTLEILNLMLNICNKLPISVSDLKNSQIGKNINKLGKCITDKQIKQKCETMVNKWKKLISDTKEEKKSFKSKDGKINEEKSETSLSSSNNYNNSSNNYPRNSYSSSNSTKNTTSRNDYSSNNSIQSSNSHLYKKRDRREFENNYYDSSEEKQNKRPKYDKSNHSSNNYKYSKDKGSTYKDKKIVKGILKKTLENEKNQKKKVKIRWESDNRIEKIKIFKLTDEPNAPEVTEEEYERIQQEILKNPHRVFEDMRDMRSREINMEKENINKVREKSNKTKEILYQMIPRLPFTILYELKIDDNDNQLAEPKESLEKEEINQIIQKTFAVKYFRDSEIPDCPKMTKEKLFNYVDVSIPKIINLKRSLDTEKVEETQKISPQIYHSLQSYIQQQYKDKDPEKMHKVLDILKNIAFQNNIINENFNFNSSQNLNISGEDGNVNLNLLHSTNTPNINPINTFNLAPNLNHVPANQFHLINNPIFSFNNEEKKNPFEPIEKKHIYNNVKPHNYRTKPCRNYNSPLGCSRGDNCYFIHDNTIKGPDNPIPQGIRYTQPYNNNIPSAGMDEIKDFSKQKEESNQQLNQNNNDNMNGSTNLLNLNNMNLNYINSNSGFVKTGPGNNVISSNMMGNIPNKINFPNNNLPHTQFNPNNAIRTPLPMMNFPPYMPSVMSNGIMRPPNNMPFPNSLPNMNMNKNPGNFAMNNNNGMSDN